MRQETVEKSDSQHGRGSAVGYNLEWERRRLAQGPLKGDPEAEANQTEDKRHDDTVVTPPMERPSPRQGKQDRDGGRGEDDVADGVDAGQHGRPSLLAASSMMRLDSEEGKEADEAD